MFGDTETKKYPRGSTTILTSDDADSLFGGNSVSLSELSDHGTQRLPAASASDQLDGHYSRGLSVDD